MTGFEWWAWVAICVAGWYAAAWLLSWWADDGSDRFDIDGHRWPIEDER